MNSIFSLFQVCQFIILFYNLISLQHYLFKIHNLILNACEAPRENLNLKKMILGSCNEQMYF